jgi:hypothetical protein
MDPERAKRIQFICISTFVLFRKCEGYIKGQTRLWHISGNIHDPLYDGGGLLELAKFSPYEIDFFLEVMK